MPCSNAKQRARSRSSSSFRVFRSVSDAVYSQIRVVLTHLSHGSSPEHLTRRLLHALHLLKSQRTLCLDTAGNKFAMCAASQEFSPRFWCEAWPRSTYALTTRFLCSGATLCRRGLTGSRFDVEDETLCPSETRSGWLSIMTKC